METFQVTREDNCIWVQDLRAVEAARKEGKPNNDAGLVHIVPEQAKELADKLNDVLKDGVLEYSIDDDGHVVITQHSLSIERDA